MYQVTSRGDRRELIYRDDTDRITHLAVLEQALERFDAEVLSHLGLSVSRVSRLIAREEARDKT